MRISMKMGQLPLLALTFAMSAACNKSSAQATGADTRSATSIIADEHGFTPSTIDLHDGRETPLTFTRTTDDTCAKEVVFPELKINEPLPLNKAVTIYVPQGPARTLTFQCGMGMMRGKVVVH